MPPFFWENKMEIKDPRGGARAGAGRKKGSVSCGEKKIFKTVSISGTPEELEKLKNFAKQSGKTVSRFVLDNLLN